jgi:hypothetical protein
VDSQTAAYLCALLPRRYDSTNLTCILQVIQGILAQGVFEKESTLSPQALYGISAVLSFIAWALVARQYIWPRLRSQSRIDALRPLLLLHSFRFVGLAFLIPGVVSPNLPNAFARPAAYGDLITAVLALLALATLQSRLGIALAWVCNIWGSVDLLHAFYQGNRTGVGLAPGLQGAAYFIPTVLVPLLLTTHVLMFWLLLRRDRGGMGRNVRA